MKTTKQYTVIMSAWQAGVSRSTNLQNTAKLAKYLEYSLYLSVINAIGHYKGAEERSFVVHTDNLANVSHIMGYVFEFYAQEAVLISNNVDKNINLFFSDDSPAMPIGSHFALGKGDGENYTQLSGINWAVA